VTSDFDAVDGSLRRHLGANLQRKLVSRECPFLAILGLYWHALRMSEAGGKADIIEL